jgi:hypothetical protein
MRRVESEHASVEKQYTEAAKRISQVQQMQEKQRTMAIQAELTASLLEKVPRSFLLAEVTNSMPSGVSLLDMILESKKRQPPRETQTKSAFEAKKVERKKPGAAAANASKSPQPEAKVFDVSVKLTGVAYTDVQVAQFISKLNTSRMLKDVNLVISDEYRKGDEQLRKFQIEMMINPDVEVTQLEKPKVTAVELSEK